MVWLFTLLLSFSVIAKFEALDPELTNYTYPFPVSFHTFQFAGENIKMAYMDVKPKKFNGQVVVLLHGKNFSGAYWEQTARDLLKEGYRVIMPDQVGFGKSSKPKTFAYTFQYLSKLTQDVLNHLKIKKYLLVGHSMGGMLAMRMSIMYPENIKKLVLVNPIGLEDWKLKIGYHTVEENYQLELKNNEDSIRRYQQNVYFDGKWKIEYDKNIEILVGWTLHPRYKEVAWTAALTSDMAFTQPVLYEIGAIKAPTMLLIGTQDRTALGKNWASDNIKAELGRYDLLGKEAAKKIPHAKLIELPGIGHMPQVEAYDLYLSHLKFFLQN